MRVLVTGHNGFIGRNVYLDWQQTLGVNNVDGIDYPDDIGDFDGITISLFTLQHMLISERV